MKELDRYHPQSSLQWFLPDGWMLEGEEAYRYLLGYMKELLNLRNEAIQLQEAINKELSTFHQTDEIYNDVLALDEILARISIYCELYVSKEARRPIR